MRRFAIPFIALSAFCGVASQPAFAEGCGGGSLSTSAGNLIGSAIGGAAGGLLGNQFGRGAGKGVMTGAGVVGGALAGGYVGRSVEGCPNYQQRVAVQARHPSIRSEAETPSRTCRFVATEAAIDGRAQQIDGVACLDEADGTWKTASGAAAEEAAQADLVLRTQQRLHDQGFYVRDNIDGRWGPSTNAALVSFQRANGLPSTGQLDMATRKALGLDSPALREGAPAASSGAAMQASDARQLGASADTAMVKPGPGGASQR